MDHETVMGEISAALASPSRDRDRIERTLTDGYALALALETERARAQKRIHALVAGIARGEPAESTKELTELTRRIEFQDDALVQLREALARLRGEYATAAG